jgi:secreted Zn-dependent insulinase-like peptidase
VIKSRLTHYSYPQQHRGSQKFPTENDYDSYVSKRGGSANAWTEWEHTSFSLEIPQDSLWGALDRLAQFFIAPLMLKSAVDRELNSIESEFLLHKNSDSVRAQELLCATCRADHPIAKFGWGNRRSLKEIPALLGVDPLQQLWTFYHRYYYAANMRLVLCSAYSLDVMQRKVVELFRDVPALPREPGPLPLPVSVDHIASWDAPAYQSPMAGAGSPLDIAAGVNGKGSHKPRIYRIVPVKDAHSLALTWSLPPIFGDWKCKSYDFLSHLLGHEASGSLLSYLKSKSWVTQCMAGVGEEGSERASSHALFTVTFILSTEGLEEWKAVCDATYQYIGMLRRQCQLGWPAWMFDELKMIHELSYKYRDAMPPDELVEGIADDIAPHVNLPPERLLDGSSLLFDFDADAIQKLLDQHLVPEKARVDVTSSSFGRACDFADGTATVGSATRLETVKLHKEADRFDTAKAGEPNVEPMFGTVFWCSEIPESLVQHWTKLAEPQAPAISVSLPRRNPFVPTKFELKSLPDHDMRHPLINCSLKLCVPVGKVLQWFPASPVQYNKTKNSLLLSYEGENDHWHSVDINASDPEFKSLRAGYEGTFDKKRVKFRVLSVSHPGGSTNLLYGDENDLDVEDGTRFPPIPPALSATRLPQEISNTNVLKMWWLQDRHFHRPSAEFRAQIICENANKSPMHMAAADLLMVLCIDALTEQSYLASLCDLTYSIATTSIGFEVSFSGFDDNIFSLIHVVTEFLLSFRSRNDGLPLSVTEERFAACLEVLDRKYRNDGMNASKLCSNIRLGCICPSFRSANEKLQTLSSISSPETFARVSSDVMADFAIEALYHGNIDKADATRARDALLHMIGPSAKGLPRKRYPPQSVLRVPLRHLPAVVRVRSLDPAEPNIAVELYTQIAKDNLRERVLIDLLVHILEEPLYNQLRTKEQIGYDVSCDARWSYGVMGLVFHVITSVKSADATVERVLKFLGEQRQELERSKDFTEYVVGLAKEKLSRFNSLGNATNHYWSEIRDGSFRWESWRDEAICLQSLTLPETLEAFDKWLMPEIRRSIVAVQVIGSGESEAYLGRPEVSDIDARDFVDAQIAQFRASCKQQTWGRINAKLF